MPEHGQRICELAEEGARDEDPESALRTLTELRHELDAFVREQVERTLARGRSFGDVARALGISRQAAHRRYRGLAPERPRERRRRLVATDAVRRVMRIARDEALAAGRSPGTEDVLLAILRTDTDAARALRTEGVTFETARACAPASDADGGHPGDPSSIRRILQQAGRVALARGDDQLGLEQLLLAVIADPEGGASRTLAALGVMPRSVRERLGC